MNTLTKPDLKILLDKEKQSGPAVSFYFPTYRATKDVEQNRINLKHMLDEAEKRLVENGFRHPDARKFLAPAAGLPEDDSF